MWGSYIHTKGSRRVLLSTLYTPKYYLSCSQQPSLDKCHPPFRLPQEHRLFERLQEMVTKGELS